MNDNKQNTQKPTLNTSINKSHINNAQNEEQPQVPLMRQNTVRLQTAQNNESSANRQTAPDLMAIARRQTGGYNSQPMDTSKSFTQNNQTEIARQYSMNQRQGGAQTTSQARNTISHQRIIGATEHTLYKQAGSASPNMPISATYSYAQSAGNRQGSIHTNQASRSGLGYAITTGILTERPATQKQSGAVWTSSMFGNRDNAKTHGMFSSPFAHTQINGMQNNVPPTAFNNMPISTASMFRSSSAYLEQQEQARREQEENNAVQNEVSDYGYHPSSDYLSPERSQFDILHFNLGTILRNEVSQATAPIVSALGDYGYQKVMQRYNRDNSSAHAVQVSQTMAETPHIRTAQHISATHVQQQIGQHTPSGLQWQQSGQYTPSSVQWQQPTQNTSFTQQNAMSQASFSQNRWAGWQELSSHVRTGNDALSLGHTRMLSQEAAPMQHAYYNVANNYNGSAYMQQKGDVESQHVRQSDRRHSAFDNYTPTSPVYSTETQNSYEKPSGTYTQQTYPRQTEYSYYQTQQPQAVNPSYHQTGYRSPMRASAVVAGVSGGILMQHGRNTDAAMMTAQSAQTRKVSSDHTASYQEQKYSKNYNYNYGNPKYASGEHASASQYRTSTFRSEYNQGAHIRNIQRAGEQATHTARYALRNEDALHSASLQQKDSTVMHNAMQSDRIHYGFNATPTKGSTMSAMQGYAPYNKVIAKTGAVVASSGMLASVSEQYKFPYAQASIGTQPSSSAKIRVDSNVTTHSRNIQQAGAFGMRASSYMQKNGDHQIASVSMQQRGGQTLHGAMQSDRLHVGFSGTDNNGGWYSQRNVTQKSVSSKTGGHISANGSLVSPREQFIQPRTNVQSQQAGMHIRSDYGQMTHARNIQQAGAFGLHASSYMQKNGDHQLASVSMQQRSRGGLHNVMQGDRAHASAVGMEKGNGGWGFEKATHQQDKRASKVHLSADGTLVSPSEQFSMHVANAEAQGRNINAHFRSEMGLSPHARNIQQSIGMATHASRYAQKDREGFSASSRMTQKGGGTLYNAVQNDRMQSISRNGRGTAEKSNWGFQKSTMQKPKSSKGGRYMAADGTLLSAQEMLHTQSPMMSKEVQQGSFRVQTGQALTPHARVRDITQQTTRTAHVSSELARSSSFRVKDGSAILSKKTAERNAERLATSNMRYGARTKGVALNADGSLSTMPMMASAHELAGTTMLSRGGKASSTFRVKETAITQKAGAHYRVAGEGIATTEAGQAGIRTAKSVSGVKNPHLKTEANLSGRTAHVRETTGASTLKVKETGAATIKTGSVIDSKRAPIDAIKKPMGHGIASSRTLSSIRRADAQKQQLGLTLDKAPSSARMTFTDRNVKPIKAVVSTTPGMIGKMADKSGRPFMERGLLNFHDSPAGVEAKYASFRARTDKDPLGAKSRTAYTIGKDGSLKVIKSAQENTTGIDKNLTKKLNTKESAISQKITSDGLGHTELSSRKSRATADNLNAKKKLRVAERSKNRDKDIDIKNTKKEKDFRKTAGASNKTVTSGNFIDRIKGRWPMLGNGAKQGLTGALTVSTAASCAIGVAANSFVASLIEASGIPACAAYYVDKTEPSEEEYQTLYENVVNNVYYSGSYSDDETKILVSQKAVDTIHKVKANKESNLIEEELSGEENLVEVTFNDASLDLNILGEISVDSASFMHTYILRPKTDTGKTFSEVSNYIGGTNVNGLSSATGGGDIAVRYRYGQTSTVAYYSTQSNNQELGGLPQEIYDDMLRGRSHAYVGGWSFSPGSSRIDIAKYQKMDKTTAALLTAHATKRKDNRYEVSLYPVYVPDKYMTYSEPITTSSTLHNPYGAGWANVDYNEIDYLEDRITQEYVYTDSNGKTIQTTNPKAVDNYNGNQVYKIILSMAVCATENTEAYPWMFVNYCEHLAEEAFKDENKGISLNFYTQTAATAFENAGRTQGALGYVEQNGYRGVQELLFCEIRQKLDVSLENLMTLDKTTADDLNHMIKPPAPDGFLAKIANWFSNAWADICDFFSGDRLIRRLLSTIESAAGDIKLATAGFLSEDAEKFLTQIEEAVQGLTVTLEIFGIISWESRFPGWDADREKYLEHCRMYTSLDDDDFRKLFMVVFPPNTNYIEGYSTEAIIWNSFAQAGYSDEAILAIMGTCKYLTGLSRDYMDTDGRIGFMRADYDDVVAFAEEKGYLSSSNPLYSSSSGISIGVQCEYLKWKIENGGWLSDEKKYKRFSNDPKNLDTYEYKYGNPDFAFITSKQFKKCSDIQQACTAFAANYFQIDPIFYDADAIHEEIKYKSKSVYKYPGDANLAEACATLSDLAQQYDITLSAGQIEEIIKDAAEKQYYPVIDGDVTYGDDVLAYLDICRQITSMASFPNAAHIDFYKHAKTVEFAETGTVQKYQDAYNYVYYAIEHFMRVVHVECRAANQNYSQKYTTSTAVYITKKPIRVNDETASSKTFTECAAWGYNPPSRAIEKNAQMYSKMLVPGEMSVDRFLDAFKAFAADKTHGYDNMTALLPPNNNLGPDYDCGSAISYVLQTMGDYALGAGNLSTESGSSAKVPITKTNFKPGDTVSGSDIRTEVVNYAKQWVGVTPYVHAGRSLETGTDCSGFINLVYQHFGMYASAGSMAYVDPSGFGFLISEEDLLPGDVIVYGGGEHVALYAGDGMVVNNGGGSWDGRAEYINMHYRDDMTGFVRIIDDGSSYTVPENSEPSSSGKLGKSYEAALQHDGDPHPGLIPKPEDIYSRTRIVDEEYSYDAYSYGEYSPFEAGAYSWFEPQTAEMLERFGFVHMKYDTTATNPSEAKLKAGDILVSDDPETAIYGDHVEIYVGNNKLAGAHYYKGQLPYISVHEYTYDVPVLTKVNGKTVQAVDESGNPIYEQHTDVQTVYHEGKGDYKEGGVLPDGTIIYQIMQGTQIDYSSLRPVRKEEGDYNGKEISYGDSWKDKGWVDIYRYPFKPSRKKQSKGNQVTGFIAALQEIADNDIYTYETVGTGGNGGCSGYISQALILAGILDEGEYGFKAGSVLNGNLQSLGDETKFELLTPDETELQDGDILIELNGGSGHSAVWYDNGVFEAVPPGHAGGNPAMEVAWYPEQPGGFCGGELMYIVRLIGGAGGNYVEGEAIMPEDFADAMDSIDDVSMEEVFDAIMSLNPTIDEEEASIIIGTAVNEGCYMDPYLTYAWACEMISSFAGRGWNWQSAEECYSIIEPWDGQGGASGYYGRTHVEEGVENASNDMYPGAETYRKAIYLAATCCDENIFSAQGVSSYGGYELYHSTVYPEGYVWGYAPR